jgi:plastocyanin
MKIFNQASTFLFVLAFSMSVLAAHQVVIEGMQFTPQNLVVKDGDTIEWINKDIFPHTSTAVNKKFDSGVIQAEGKWKTTVKGKGKIDYFCNLHPTMKASLTVK